mmetsp:Transcript_34233/g.72078  ORF Transcript_34233/g.72078 Transcript_34233/m.72078 type:complete len:194 (+) Transcript_34233:308-889(+)
MKRFRSSFFLSLVAAFLLLGTQHPPLSPLVHASATGPADAPNSLAEYQPAKKKGGIGRVLDWGLAKLEHAYDGGLLVSDLIAAFITKCDHIIAIMIHSFRDMTLSYEELHEKEKEHLQQFDQEFRGLVKLRNKIDRKCLYSKSADDRSLCIDRGIEIHEKIQELRSQRLKSEGAIERYKGMIDWCGGYNNWFC